MTDYAELSELGYQRTADPWGAWPSHKRYWLHERLWRLACAMVPNWCVSIVEHGCGLGKLVWQLSLQDRHRSVIGLDTSPTAIGRARRAFPACRFAVADVRTWVPETPVDLAIVSGPYHHAADRVALLRHIRSYLEPRGYILIIYMSPKRLVGKVKANYPDLADEIFSEFAPVECIERVTVDPENGEQGAWRLYLGQKR